MTEPGITSGSKRGHILLVAIVLVTLMSVMLAMVMRPVRTTSDRMKEAELLYRGNHLAEGIRRFYVLNGRFPFELEELVEGEHRLVRKLYADPMTDDGEWELVFLNATDRNAVKGLDALARAFLGSDVGKEMVGDVIDPKELEGVTEDEEDKRPESPFEIQQNQITGIRSKSEVEGLTVRDESRIYSDWLFSALPQSKVDKEKISGMIQQIMDQN